MYIFLNISRRIYEDGREPCSCEYLDRLQSFVLLCVKERKLVQRLGEMAYFNTSVNLTSEATSTDLPPGHSPLKVSLYLQATIITMYTIIVMLAIGGNSIICYVVFRTRKMRTVMNFFIVSLALSDILVAVMCIPFTFLANLVLNYWPFGDILCPIVTFLQAVTVFVSSFTLVSISRDRYVAIIYPLRPKLTKRQTLIIIAGIWIISGIIPLPTAILSRTHRYVNTSTAPLFCEEIWGNQQAKYGYTVVIWFLQHIIPLMILGFSYGRIIIVLWIKKTPGEAATVRDQRMSESKKKVIYNSWLRINVMVS